MRQPRITIDSSKAEAAYLCQCLFAPDINVEDEAFTRIWGTILRKAAAFTGVKVQSFRFESTHFKINLIVPKAEEVDDEEVFRRYWELNDPETRRNRSIYKRLRKQLDKGSAQARKWCRSQRRRMFDLSRFIKLINERFASIYNREHGRRGSVFQQHFESSVYQPHDSEPDKVAPLLDMVEPGSTQRDCCDRDSTVLLTTLDRADTGDTFARSAIMAQTGCDSWEEASALYSEQLKQLREEAEKPVPLDEDLMAELEEWQRQGIQYSGNYHCAQLEYMIGCCAFGTAIFVAKLIRYYRELGYEEAVRKEPLVIQSAGDSCEELAVLRRPGA